jgi:Flp pilus assembly protein TadG
MPRPVPLRRLASVLARFGRDERASVTVEAVLILPPLLWAFLVTFSWFDIYRVKSQSLKANYAISDLMSRETRALDMAYLNGVEQVYEFLTRADTDAWVRVTVVRCTNKCAEPDRTLKRDWSKATDEVPILTDADVMNDFESIVPVIASGERVIVVETSMLYTPPFSQKLTGIAPRTMRDIVMTRPRFAPQLCWQGENCGT